MFGSFYISSGKPVWFKLEGNMIPSCLPIAIFQNEDKTEDVQVDVESSSELRGALTDLMAPMNVPKNGGMARTDIPKFPVGGSPVVNCWCRILATAAKQGIPVLVTLHGVKVNMAGSPILE